MVSFIKFAVIFHLNISRAYLILRPKDKSDPDPELMTVLLFIWPLMLLITVADLLLLVFIAGLTGILIFPVLLLCFGINYIVIRLVCRETIRRDDIESQNQSEPKQEEDSIQNEEGASEQNGLGALEKTKEGHSGQNTAEGPEENKENGSEQADNKEKKNLDDTAESFYAVAALSSIWLPCVVGDQSLRIFLVSGVTSLVTKVLFLVLALALASSGLQPHIYKRPFLLFCFNEDSPIFNEPGIKRCNYLEDGCRPPTNLTQETRLADALFTVEKAVLEYKRILNETRDDDLKTKEPHNQDFLVDKLNIASEFLNHINSSRAEIDNVLNPAGIGKVQQRIRVCGNNETTFQVSILSGLIIVILLAAYATYRLHKIADYRVKLTDIAPNYVHSLYRPQELFNSSKMVMGCIPSSKFRVIHRSLGFEAIED